MDTKFQISVVIPNFNRAAFLKLAIESVLQQTYPVLEIIVCDDGSTDNAKAIVEGFNPAIVKWLPCGNNGRPAIPRNKGIAAAKGDVIAFLDNDDVWHPTKLQKQVNELQKGFGMVCTNANRVSGGKILSKLQATKGDSTFNFYHMVSTNQVVCSSVIIKKDLLLQADGFPESPSLKALEDYALWLRLSSLAEIRYLHEALLDYTDEVSSSIRKDSLSTAQQMKLIYQDFSAWLKRSTHFDKHLQDLACEVLLRRYLSPAQKFLHRLLQP